jgi:DNA-directed RNA polymerase specialized sigma24 family protein
MHWRTEVLVERLDALSRCALVMCGIEKRSSREAAVIMGVGKSTVELGIAPQSTALK